MKNNPPIIGFIVEGLSDKDLLEQNFENVRAAHCDGTVMNNRIKSRIYALENHADIIYIFTDPDSAGDAFANRIVQDIKSYPRLRIDPEACEVMRGIRKKYGVEYASLEYLVQFFKENIPYPIIRKPIEYKKGDE